MSSALFACSKCFSRHPFEELSQGQQLCKECRGSFPVVKCTYCRSEFQQESKNNTCSICKRCEANVQKYGKPSCCAFCNIIAAFTNGKCHRCHDSLRKYGPPKTCEQCKQKCAFDRDEKKKLDGKLLCWLCSLSYKRALVRTKQSDPARHSRVFKEKDKEKHRDKRDKYFNHKKPQRLDVTKHLTRIKDTDDTDHVREITQLKETIASLNKQVGLKNNELVFKQEKMKKMSKQHEDKVTELQRRINNLQSEVTKLRRDSKPKPGQRKSELFPKKDLIIRSSTVLSTSFSNKSISKKIHKSRSRSRSSSSSRNSSPRNRRSRSRSPKTRKSRSRSPKTRKSRSRSPKMSSSNRSQFIKNRGRSSQSPSSKVRKSPNKRISYSRSGSESPKRSLSNSLSRSVSPNNDRSRSRSIEKMDNKRSRSRSRSVESQESFSVVKDEPNRRVDNSAKSSSRSSSGSASPRSRRSPSSSPKLDRSRSSSPEAHRNDNGDNSIQEGYRSTSRNSSYESNSPSSSVGKSPITDE
ncbi:Protein FAM76B,Protein FAM76A [Lepeophtheirus salmonis]|uniref:Protein FAM76B,Protein FAM76A n=1 Tax=Lepeophtheirus salmonis TaxID=72036 RepID=A0A7R8CNM2_LEPSM|nr:Protein FAM76B,Protein FAM76A [Lepeophtheirus salmonis]CAF2873711.1 Protein FAM76B,Protein FAM76A [Lepeophtheirus salmonis]